MEIYYKPKDYEPIIDRSKPQPRGFYPNYTVDDFCEWERGWEMMEGFPWMRDPNLTPDEERMAELIGQQFLDGLADAQNYGLKLPIYNDIGDLMAMQPDLVLHHLPIIDAKCCLPHAELVLHFQLLSPPDDGIDPRPGVYAALEVPYYILINPMAQKIKILHLEAGEYKTQANGVVDAHVFEVAGQAIQIDFKSIWREQA